MWLTIMGPTAVLVLGATALYYRHQSRKGIVFGCPKCGSADCELVTDVYVSKVKSVQDGKVKEAITFSYICNHCGAVRTVANIPVEEEEITRS